MYAVSIWEDRLSDEEMAAVGEADGGGHRSVGVGGIHRHALSQREGSGAHLEHGGHIRDRGGIPCIDVLVECLVAL